MGKSTDLVYRILDNRLSTLRSLETVRYQFKWSEEHYNGMRQAHGDVVARIIRDLAPSGSGFDNGTILDNDKTRDNRLVFSTSFHHMNDVGMYDGWTKHEVIVYPTFYGYALRVTGRNRNNIKEHISEVFRNFLDTETER